MALKRRLMGFTRDFLVAVAENFEFAADILDVREYGSGRINDTFLVNLGPEGRGNAVLQRINENVFAQPDRVVSNMRVVTEHMREQLRHDQGRRWEVPGMFRAKDGRDYFIDQNGSFWRAMSFIPASTYDSINDAGLAQEVGYGLGRFHSLISGLEINRLFDTLKGFHITPEYLNAFDRAVDAVKVKKESLEMEYCLRFINTSRQWASVLEDAKVQKKLSIRPIHGDPKFDNIMFDEKGCAIGMVDLDTVKPGLVQYDIGDCLRSCCNSGGEETGDLRSVDFRTDFCGAVLRGYVSAAGGFLDDNDYDYIYDSARLIAFELGLRFFTDHLAGNKYFKVKKQGENLQRALIQFKLTESIESQEEDIRSIIEDLKR